MSCWKKGYRELHIFCRQKHNQKFQRVVKFLVKKHALENIIILCNLTSRCVKISLNVKAASRSIN